MSPLPEVDSQTTLQHGAGALGLELDHPTTSALLRDLALLQKWNRVHNLTAVRDPAAMLTHHLLDSLAVVLPLRRWLVERSVDWRAPLRVLDVGSGAGLPGIVLALLHPNWHVDCVDAVGKKAAFVQQAAVELGLTQVRGLHARVETLTRPDQGYDVITARAFAALEALVDLTAPLLRPGGFWLAMKGRDPQGEMMALPPQMRVFHVEPLQVPGLDAARCVLALEPVRADSGGG